MDKRAPSNTTSQLAPPCGGTARLSLQAVTPSDRQLQVSAFKSATRRERSSFPLLPSSPSGSSRAAFTRSRTLRDFHADRTNQPTHERPSHNQQQLLACFRTMTRPDMLASPLTLSRPTKCKKIRSWKQDRIDQLDRIDDREIESLSRLNWGKEDSEHSGRWMSECGALSWGVTHSG